MLLKCKETEIALVNSDLFSWYYRIGHVPLMYIWIFRAGPTFAVLLWTVPPIYNYKSGRGVWGWTIKELITIGLNPNAFATWCRQPSCFKLWILLLYEFEVWYMKGLHHHHVAKIKQSQQSFWYVMQYSSAHLTDEIVWFSLSNRG